MKFLLKPHLSSIHYFFDKKIMTEQSHEDSLILITKLRGLHDYLYSSGSKNDGYSMYCVDKIEQFLREYDRGLINYKSLCVIYVQILSYSRQEESKRNISLFMLLMIAYIRKNITSMDVDDF